MWAVCPQPLVFWVDGDNLSPSFIVNIVNVFQGLLSGCWVLLRGGFRENKNHAAVTTIFPESLKDFLWTSVSGFFPSFILLDRKLKYQVVWFNSNTWQL